MQPLINILHKCELYGNGAVLYLHLLLIQLMSVKKDNKVSILAVSMTWNCINQQAEAKPVNLPHAPSHFHFPFNRPPPIPPPSFPQTLCSSSPLRVSVLTVNLLITCMARS